MENITDFTNFVIASLAIADLVLISGLHSPEFVMRAPRYTNCFKTSMSRFSVRPFHTMKFFHGFGEENCVIRVSQVIDSPAADGYAPFPF